MAPVKGPFVSRLFHRLVVVVMVLMLSLMVVVMMAVMMRLSLRLCDGRQAHRDSGNSGQNERNLLHLSLLEVK
jgi:hypothetical protein